MDSSDTSSIFSRTNNKFSSNGLEKKDKEKIEPLKVSLEFC
jgi:hypothetical protein